MGGKAASRFHPAKAHDTSGRSACEGRGYDIHPWQGEGGDQTAGGRVGETSGGRGRATSRGAIEPANDGIEPRAAHRPDTARPGRRYDAQRCQTESAAGAACERSTGDRQDHSGARRRRTDSGRSQGHAASRGLRQCQGAGEGYRE